MHANVLRVGTLSAVLLSSFALAQEMPRGSFLLGPVQSRYQLIEQIQTDPEVSARY